MNRCGVVCHHQRARWIRISRYDNDSRTGAADEVGDEADTTVGLWDDKNTKNRPLGQAGRADGRDGELSYNHERL